MPAQKRRGGSIVSIAAFERARQISCFLASWRIGSFRGLLWKRYGNSVSHECFVEQTYTCLEKYVLDGSRLKKAHMIKKIIF